MILEPEHREMDKEIFSDDKIKSIIDTNMKAIRDYFTDLFDKYMNITDKPYSSEYCNYIARHILWKLCEISTIAHHTCTKQLMHDADNISVKVTKVNTKESSNSVH